jgi:glycosyltransferase involved in cell wall biosynthesis
MESLKNAALGRTSDDRRPPTSGESAQPGQASTSAEPDPASDRVPVVVNSFNQPTYLRIMIDQLLALGCRHIMVLDQGSTYPPLLDYLTSIETVATVIRLKENNGPHWFFTSGLSTMLPEYFIYTDPDIAFGPEMPRTVISDLVRAARFLNATKVGLALDVSQPERMSRATVNIGGRDYTIPEWESRFWRDPLRLDDLELYRASVDTTFALYRREFFDPQVRAYMKHKLFDSMDTPSSFRLGGKYTCVHTPWMLDDPMPPEELQFYLDHRVNIHDY